MIGIDTNLLLRLLLDDEPEKRAKIEALLASHGQAPSSVMISDIVLAEAVWTLRTVYAQPKSALITAIRSLLAQDAFGFEDRAAVEHALGDFTHTTAGFPDCLIAVKYIALGCQFCATFDKKMRSLPGVRVLSA